MEYLLFFLNIISNIFYNLSNIKNVTIILLNIMTGVGIIKGFSYIKDLQIKKNAAAFTFWSQFRVRIYELLTLLENENGLINNLYNSSSRVSWPDALTPDEKRIKEFKNKAQEVIIYIESTADQMPAYIGWTDDYIKIIEFLNDIIQYDISDSEKYFKFNYVENIEHRKTYCENICEIMKRLCDKIETKQKEIEIKLLKDEL